MSKKTFLVIDKGLYPHISEALSDEGKNRVLYATPWETKDPHFRDFVVGKGFGHLEKVMYPEDYYEKADSIIFWDVSGNALCNFLRKIYPNKSIVGAGLGERLENDRVLLKEWCKELGLPVSNYVVVKGVTALREHLKKNKDKYVKVNVWRGDLESFHSPDYDSIEQVIDEMAVKLGSDKEEFDFIVDDTIKDALEIGADTFFNGTEFIRPMFAGIEKHKNLYVAKVMDEIPILGETLNAFTPLLSKMNYRGPLSTEELVKSKTEHYWIDACMRLPNPLSALYPVMIENWSEFIYEIGLGHYVEPEIKHKCVGAFGLSSLAAKESYVKVNIKEGYEDKVRYQMVTGRGEKNYAVPGWEVVAILVAGGNTVDEVLEGLKEAAEGVDAHFLDKDPIEGIHMIKEDIKKAEKLGIM